jgi:integrase
MPVLPIRKPATETESKAVAANQKAIDALPLDSGTWRVAGVPGLYLRCRAKSRSFFIQRRVRGALIKETLGTLTMKEAKEASMKAWGKLEPKPSPHQVVTLGMVIDRYLEEKQLADETKKNYRKNADSHLREWKDRSMREVGEDREGIRWLVRMTTKQHGRATANQVIRLLSSVYRWQRKVDASLPESPTTAVEVHRIPARDWAFSPPELQKWWHSTVKSKDGKLTEFGVSTLGPIKRAWWIAALLTGARKGSLEALKWADLDFEKKVIHFRVTKGDRPYKVPMSDTLAALIGQYRESDEVPPSPWVFPSTVRDGQHIVGVKNTKEGVQPAHRLRHSFRTTLAELGAPPDQARLLMGHSMGGDVSRGYITAPLVVESLRPWVNAVAEHYLKIIPGIVK